MNNSTSSRPEHASGTSVPSSQDPWAANWENRLSRSEIGTPLLPAEFVAGQGVGVRLIDVRDPQEFIGSVGYIPGSDWIPVERIDSLPERLGLEAPLVLISGTGERASELTRSLVQQRMRYVAALDGGVARWLSLGYSTTRDPSILDRCDVLHPIEPVEPLAGGQGLSIEQVEQHIGHARAVRWIKLAALVLHAQVSCIDGRDDRGVIGSPGGDAGQFLLALAALEKTLNRTIEPEVIAALLARRIDALGGFYMHTDHTAMTAAVESMKTDPRLQSAVAEFCSDEVHLRQFLRRPPLMLRDAVLEHLSKAGAIGCGHIRLMLQHSDQYRLRPGLVLDFLRAFFQARWEGAFRANYESLHGRHDERAVLNTRIEGSVHPFTPVPLISPSGFGCQMFVYHSQVSEYLRGLLVDFLHLQSDLVPEFADDIRPKLLAEIKELDGIQTANSLGYLAKGLPIYNVVFGANGQVRVEFAGKVE